MNEVIGQTLPFALAIAISPMPIIAVILMLMSPRPKPMGLAFLLGWLAGITVAVGLFTLLAGIIPEKPESADPEPIRGSIQLVLGLLLGLLAVKQWRSRPKAGDVAKLPAWMAAIDTMKPPAALGLAALLAAVNPKNLLMAAAAGLAVGHSALGAGGKMSAVAIVVVVAALSVAAPVVVYLLAPGKAAAVLDDIRSWLTANNAAIMMVVMAVLGVSLIGKGLGSF